MLLGINHGSPAEGVSLEHMEARTNGVGESANGAPIVPVLVEVADVVLGDGGTHPLTASA